MRKKFPTVLGCVDRRFLSAYVLYFLSAQPSYASKLREQLKKTFNLEVKYSAVYYCLWALERDGHAQSSKARKDGQVIKEFSITEAGTVHLEEMIEFLKR
ncbi:MAG: PadR family transcriptional regulator [Thermoproteota archaeon]|nr:PadR family transcriptional regulator [Thermoproteota archaeon]NLD66313.1 PadR family transcriptional regulator [Thermoproteota archaeon]